jgi:hypothetical protein
MWQGGFGSTTDADYLDLWEGGFGSVETLAAATTTVPEPSAIRFAIMAALIFLLYGRFGKRRSMGVSL